MAAPTDDGRGPGVTSVLVIGVGNRYGRDDGAGLAAASRLGAAAGVPTVLVDNMASGLDLIDLWRDAGTVILTDAVRSGAAAGTVHRLEPSGADEAAEILRILGAPRTLGGSTHGLGVAEAVALARTLGRLPRRLVVLGIEGARFDAGEDLSPAVEQALDDAVRSGLEEIARAGG